MNIHPNVIRTWTEWQVEHGNHMSVLVVETDLELNVDADGFDASKYNEMVAALVEHFANHPATIDRIRVVPKGVSHAPRP